jgi:hypothetical protein
LAPADGATRLGDGAEAGTLVGVAPGVPAAEEDAVDPGEPHPVTASTKTADPRTIRRFTNSSLAGP